MRYEQYENLFRSKAGDAGYSEEITLKCLKYARPLIEKNVPVIFNTSNLAALVGYRKTYLKRVALYTNYFYRDFVIKKKNGSTRTISEPLPSLKEIQIWVLENILYNIPVSRYAKAYIKKRNLVENVRFHRDKPIVVCFDIANFFSSITRENIENFFLNIGYSSNISNLLSKICCVNEQLPQGAPTSSYLSNIFLIEFDEKISSYCKKMDIRYTRYADDMTFSGNIDIRELTKLIESELEKRALKLNTQKTRVMLPHERQVVTGIVVNNVIQIPKVQRKKIRQEVHFIKKFGLLDHLSKTNNRKANYIRHLLGKINFALHINPKDEEMKGYKEFIITFLSTD